jgi:acetolactate synthase-1/2/3 large subunit
MNIVAQLEAELGDVCIVIDEIEQLSQKLDRVRTLLGQSKPVAIAFHPDVLSRPARISLPRHDGQAGTDRGRVETFSRELASCTAGRRVIIFVGSEAARCAGIQPLTTALSTRLGAPTVWSVNGANAVASDNPYGFGYMAFGGNDRALALWRGIGPGDVVIALGLDPGEYTLDLEPIAAGDVFHLTSIPDAYGSERGGFGHRVSGRYHQLRGDIACLVREILSHLPDLPTSSEPAHAPHDLNTRPSPREVRAGCVDLVAFYEAMTTLWRPGSIGFDDVCMAYKDRQYITQRPHRNIRFYALQDGSAMGAAFGLGLGAKLANPNLHTFVFSGDGCFRLFGGGLADAAGLGLRLFILNNGNYAIVETGLRVILPDVETRRYHGRIPRIDFALAALAHGWKPFRVEPDLRNLPEIMDACYTAGDQSVLVDIPVDGDQDIGVNPRVYNLKHQTHL